MLARHYWRAVTVDESDLLGRFLDVLGAECIRFCVIGGQGVNAYVDPVVSLDLDIVVAVEDVERLEELLASQFLLECHEHSLNVGALGSDLRIQIQRDPRYAGFVPRAQERSVLGLALPVAQVEDVLQGKVWAVTDESRRASKRQKDLADIARLLEAEPRLRSLVPPAVLDRLL